MSKDQQRNEEIQPGKCKLSAEKVAEIREVFMETGGYVSGTARRTGFAKSTVSRYARKRGWHEELCRSPVSDKDNEKIVSVEDKENGDAEEQVMPKLIALRELLFEEIMGDKKTDATGAPKLKILPRTLAEVVKALIDIDKRITEREGNQPTTMLDTYQSILARCARVIENKSE